MAEDTGEIDIDYVAKLARIELTDEEKSTFSGQLGDILGHFEKLKAIDVEGVEPTAHAFDVKNVWAEDEPQPSFSPEEALRNAPVEKDNHLVVPKVVGDS